MTQKQRTVLLIDDSPEDRETYKRYLLQDNDYSYTILEAGFGAQGLELCEGTQIDGVLLDYLLPGLDGLEFLVELQKRMNGNHPPVIMVTGEGDEAIAVQAIKSGCFDYLVKGRITPDGLRLAMDRAIEKTQLGVQLQQSEERLKLALEAAQMGTWEWKIPSNTLVWSDLVGPIFGLPPGFCPPTYEAYLDVVHPEDRDYITQSLTRTLESGTEYEVEFRTIWPDGSLHWVCGKGKVYYDKAGQPIRMLGTVMDITKSKRGEIARESQIQRERLVIQIAQCIRESLNLDDILNTAVQEVRQFLQSDRVLIFRFHPDWQGTVVAESVSPECNPILLTSIYDPCFAQTWIEPYKNGRINAVTDIYTAGLNPCHVELLSQFQVRGNLVVPILQKDHLWGLLIAHQCSASRQWQQLEMDLLSSLATQLGIAIQQSTLFEQAQIDLTERKRAEAELRYTLGRLNFLVENSPLGVVEWDAEFRVCRWSAEAERIFGWKAQEVIGKKFTDWQFVLQEDLEIVQASVTRLAEGIEQRNISGNCNYTKDGSVVHCEWYNSVLLDESGKLISVLSLVLNVTERKRVEAALRESENLFRQMADSAPVLIWLCDINKHCYYFNKPWLDFTGETIEQAIGNGWVQGVHPDDRQYFLETYINAFDARQEFKMEYRLKRFDGEYRWILDIGIPRFTSVGNFLGYIGSCIDISDRKQAEEERTKLLEQEQAARADAETANRIKDEFLAVLSHELRTPLNPILGWTQILQKGQINEAKTAEALLTIERNARLQAQLIDDLLDVSQILRGKMMLNVSLVNLESIILASLETVHLAAEAKSIKIKTRFEENVGDVTGDSARLQQVFWNLLSNAIKFTPSGGSVEVRLECVDRYAQITVSDTGRGINADFLPYVFDYFRQADSSTTRKFGGLGLGLAIVRQLVELHGGTIQAESPGEGQGATFTAKLPLLNSREVIEQGSRGCVENEESNSSHPKPILEGLLVLVVDDDADSRDLIAFILEQDGATVWSVASAVEALQILARSKPDILVSDIGMPQMDGYMLMRQVRSLQPEQGGQIPAIALTAYAGETDNQQILQAGFHKHITKPVDPAELVTVIATLVKIIRNS
ncbi:MAG: PAS domain S-box protein [Stigonema ocellatum SAG 48.90 = DSM 106950]|nr:PAS domain S-box protein [Stigonema ocellatum SAG 48.90 = DSM 106950]